MRSLVVLDIEHDENTDDLTDTVQEIADNIYSASCWNRNLKMTNYTVRVNLSPRLASVPVDDIIGTSMTNHNL